MTSSLPSSVDLLPNVSQDNISRDMLCTTCDKQYTYFVPPYPSQFTRDEFRQFIIPGLFYITSIPNSHKTIKLQNIENEYIDLFINPLESGGRATCVILGKTWTISICNIFENNRLIHHLI
jgi:hypothetical protein